MVVRGPSCSDKPCRECDPACGMRRAGPWFSPARVLGDLEMRNWAMLAIAGVMAFGASAALAQDAAPAKKPMVAVIGTVSAVTPTEVDVTGKDGTKTAIMLGDKTRYS